MKQHNNKKMRKSIIPKQSRKIVSLTMMLLLTVMFVCLIITGDRSIYNYSLITFAMSMCLSASGISETTILKRKNVISDLKEHQDSELSVEKVPILENKWINVTFYVGGLLVAAAALGFAIGCRIWG